VRGEGVYLFDESGNRYLDMVAGIAVCALGHAHPRITRAIADQAATLVHCSNLYHHEPAGILADRLAELSGFDAVFFCNSGAEANEAAIKLARKFAWRKGEKERTTILACNGSFHGRTLGALAATDAPAYKEGFAPMPDGFAFTPFNDIDALSSAIVDRTAAFIVEPVQGESGVLPATPEFLAAARDFCTQRGALLIFDEVQVGMGRLGRLFASQLYDVQPDAFTPPRVSNPAITARPSAAPRFRRPPRSSIWRSATSSISTPTSKRSGPSCATNCARSPISGPTSSSPRAVTA
jgi:acetylornithine/succinyldiaminopimelate/putrescine aminotransferase